MRRMILIALGMLLAFHAGAYAEQKTLSVKDILSVRIPAQVSAATAGGAYAVVVREPDFDEGVMKTSIWVGGRGGPAQFTTGARKEHNPLWSPDGKHLAFLGEVNGKAQVFVLPALGGEAKCITDASEGVIDFDWLNGGSVAYLTPEAEPGHSGLRKDRARETRNDGRIVDARYAWMEIWKAPLEGGKGKCLYRGGPGVLDIDVSPGGGSLLFTDNGTGRLDDARKTDVRVLDLADGKVRTLVERSGEESQAQWSPSSDRIAFLAHLDPEKPYSRADIYVVPSAGGAPVNLTASLDRNVIMYRWSSDGASLYAVVEDGAHHSICRIDAEGGKVVTLLQDRQYLYAFDVAGPDDLLFSREEPARSPDICRLSPSTGKMERLSDFNPWLKDYRLAPLETVQWRNPRDGKTIEGVLVKPLDYVEGKRYPLVVRIHGGPYGTAADSLLYYIEYQALPPLGYMVLAPNYRGSSGWGNEFGVCNYRDLGGMDYLDIMSGVDFLVEIGLADPQRLGVAGLSYGGYMTNWIVGHTDRFKAAVSISGIFTLASDFSNSSFPAWEREYLGAYYWEDREAYDAMSPGTCVKNIRTPVLIIHGDEDNNTFVTNSQELYQALFHMGRTVQFVRYPREGHELEEPNHILDAMEREIRWFDRYIMGREWRVRLGEWAEGEALSARVDGWSAEPEIREAGRAHAVQEKGDERYVLVLRVRGSGGEVLHPCRDVAVIDKDENQWAPAGVLAGEGKSRYSMKGDIAVTLEQEREIVISLIFDLPPKAGGLRLSVRDLPLMQLSPP